MGMEKVDQGQQASGGGSNTGKAKGKSSWSQIDLPDPGISGNVEVGLSVQVLFLNLLTFKRLFCRININ
jgi:hypothetical protein